MGHWLDNDRQAERREQTNPLKMEDKTLNQLPHQVYQRSRLADKRFAVAAHALHYGPPTHANVQHRHARE